MADVFDYSCPFCNKPTTLTPERISRSQHHFFLANADGSFDLLSAFFVCPNPSCRKASLRVELAPIVWEPGPQPVSRVKSYGPPKTWSLIPPSMAKAFPSYVPASIREDYEEACLIVDGSPKASAT